MKYLNTLLVAGALALASSHAIAATNQCRPGSITASTCDTFLGAAQNDHPVDPHGHGHHGHHGGKGGKK